MKEVEKEGLPIVDVDGSYLYRKYEVLADAGENVSLSCLPPPPISGWTLVSETNYQSIAPSIPLVTQGIVCIQCARILHFKFCFC